MVKVQKLGGQFVGIDESGIEGDFWDEIRRCVGNGDAVIVANSKEDVEDIVFDEIEWIED